MDMIVYGLVILLVIWYIGKPLNAMINGAGEVASKEFDYYRDSQDLDLAKRYNQLNRQIDTANITATRKGVKNKLTKLVGTSDSHTEATSNDLSQE